MIVYQKDKSAFLQDTFAHDIEAVILSTMRARTGHGVGAAEIRSWKESLLCMAKVLNDPSIPDDAGVAVEYGIPQSSKRIDFIVSGLDEEAVERIVIVELKQWSQARRTQKDGIVITRFAGGEQEVSHPSYQAWSYATLLRDFNEAVYDGGIVLDPCAYLHNYAPDGAIDHPFYGNYLERAPIFLEGEAERERLRAFIRRFVRKGDRGKAIYELDGGRIRPSKMLADALQGMLQGKAEFVLIDDQKVVFETALALARKANTGRKQVLLVEGGPGTGKTVLAINLLASLTSAQFVCRYVSKNAAPRAVYEAKLTGSMRATRIRNLFSGSGAFVEATPDAWDVLIVDEAHRLNEKSGLYGNLGENQAKEILAAAKCVVFFIDDDQRVTLSDIGEKAALRQWAKDAGADVTEAALASQFRCSGSDGYLAWVDDTLQVRETANKELDPRQFDFRVYDSPSELHQAIVERNKIANRSRVVAGYCWKWPSKKDSAAFDIELPEFEYRRRWNLDKDGSLWIIAPDSVEEVGCIHTCQGLELDVVGVIIGPDLVVRDGMVVTRPEFRASSDKSLRGYKVMARADADRAYAVADRIIKNTYRTLLTRGMKGCWVYCADAETAAWFRSRLLSTARQIGAPTDTVADARGLTDAQYPPDFPFRSVVGAAVLPYENALPVLSLPLAIRQPTAEKVVDVSNAIWVQPPRGIALSPDLFIARATGVSVAPQIPECQGHFNSPHPWQSKFPHPVGNRRRPMT